MVQLDPTAEDKRQAREALLGLLARADRQRRWPQGWRAGWPSSTRRRRTSARPARRCSGCWPVQTDSQAAERLAGGVAQLDPTAEDKRQARDALLGLLARETDSRAAGAAGGRGGPARPDGGGQAPGPRGAARAAGP